MEPRDRGNSGCCARGLCVSGLQRTISRNGSALRRADVEARRCQTIHVAYSA